MTTLIIAEKPSVALDIAKVLGAAGRRDGYFESKDGRYRVTWALGHLLQLPKPHEINPAWKAWRAELLPMLPDSFPLVARDARAHAQLAMIAKLLRDRQTTDVVNACDAGREGELIFRYIIAKVGLTKPCRRLWISSLTPEDIRRGFQALRPGEEYDRLGDAGRARDQADWLLGMNGSRAVRIATGGEFSVGRVQTPTLAMVVERDRAIRAHVAETYYEVVARFEVVTEHSSRAGDLQYEDVAQFAATYVRERPEGDGKASWDSRLWPNEYATDQEHSPEAVKARALAGEARVVSVSRKERVTESPELYDLTTLQRTANYRYGWAASKTLELLQRLYEEHKVVTYPRTDSRHLTSTVAATLPAIVEMLRPVYRDDIVAETGRVPLSKRFVNDGRVSDHHAIIPTGTPPSALSAGSELFSLYDLICRRLLAAWQPAYVEAVTAVALEVSTEHHRDRYATTGVDVVALGWRTLEPMQQTSVGNCLPSGLEEGTDAIVRDATTMKRKTRAPKHYTEATLLSAMENAGEHLGEDTPAAIRDAMRERGLGTPATRAAIIEMLVTRRYIEREGKALKSTSLGEALVLSVADTLKDPGLTGDWEARLRRIERGEESYEQFMAAIVAYVRECVADAFARPSPTAGPPARGRPDTVSSKRRVAGTDGAPRA